MIRRIPSAPTRGAPAPSTASRTAEAGPRALRAASRRPRLPRQSTPYQPAPLTGATLEDWQLAVAAHLPLPTARVRFEALPARAVVVGHAGRCPVTAPLVATTFAELLAEGAAEVPATYELTLCAACRPDPLAWYLEVVGLAVRTSAVSAPLRSGHAAAAEAWELVPVLVAALGTRDHPAAGTVAACAATQAPPPATTASFAREVRSWVTATLRNTLAVVDETRDRTYHDGWLVKALKLAGLPGDVDPGGDEVWVLCDMPAVLSAARRSDHKLLVAALLHPDRFATEMAANGSWWAVRLPAAWRRALPDHGTVRATGPARLTGTDPALVTTALRLWADATAAGPADDPLIEPAAAVATTAHLST